jgi:hypothetical protein
MTKEEKIELLKDRYKKKCNYILEVIATCVTTEQVMASRKWGVDYFERAREHERKNFGFPSRKSVDTYFHACKNVVTNIAKIKYDRIIRKIYD